MANLDDDFNIDDENEVDDDITSGYEDDEQPVLSFADQERLQQKFEQEVAKRRVMLRRPKQYGAKERVEAAYWLGEAGDPQAIPELVLVYNRDKTKGMKEAATYALGMFKALKNTWENPEQQEEVYDISENIIFRGQFGKRFSSAQFMMPQIGLGVSFVVLLVIGFLAGQFSSGQQASNATAVAVETELAPTPTEDTFDFAVDDLSAYYNDLDNDARVLQGQMSTVTQGQSQDCTIVFINPQPYNLSQARQDDEVLVNVTTQLNERREALIPIRDAFQDACDTGQAIARGTGLELAQSVIAVQNGLRAVASELFGEETGAEAPPTLEFTPAPVVSPTPQPTINFSIIRPHFDSLTNIISQMTVPIRGNATRQEVFWQNLLDFRSSEGCEQPAITVPEDYDLPVDLGNQFPDLGSAASSVNTGLAALRDSVSGFALACQAEDPTTAANTGVAQAQLALASFREAQGFLDALQP